MTTLQQALGYELKHPNPVQRAAQRLGSTRPGAWVLSRTLEPLDKAALRITGGRASVAAALAAVPIVTLHTVGARSGVRRSTPLIGVPLDGAISVIGTNYGQRPTPGWVYNLEARPEAEVTYRTATVAVVARHAEAEETEAAFARAAALYPGYDAYRSRIRGRSIRVFVLDLV